MTDFNEFGNYIETSRKSPYIIESTPQPVSNYDTNKYAFALCSCNESGFGYGIPIKRSNEWHYFKCLKCGMEGEMYA